MCGNLTGESLITMSAAAKLTAGRPHPSSLWRWTKKGVGGVRLESVQVGGRVFTSREALQRFVAALNPATVPTEAEAEAELSQAGI